KVVQYKGIAINPLSPKRQSTAVMATAETINVQPAWMTIGLTKLAAVDTSRESSATRETKSPRPARSTVSESKVNAASSTDSRKLAMAGSRTRASNTLPHQVPNAAMMPPTTISKQYPST